VKQKPTTTQNQPTSRSPKAAHWPDLVSPRYIDQYEHQPSTVKDLLVPGLGLSGIKPSVESVRALRSSIHRKGQISIIDLGQTHAGIAKGPAPYRGNSRATGRQPALRRDQEPGLRDRPEGRPSTQHAVLASDRWSGAAPLTNFETVKRSIAKVQRSYRAMGDQTGRDEQSCGGALPKGSCRHQARSDPMTRKISMALPEPGRTCRPRWFHRST